jgi:tetratricopeptide (TPR) repeat protein
MGGLVLQGRELPGRSVAGRDTFDAAEIRLRSEADEVAMQPTTSLLVGLRDVVSSAVFTGVSQTGEGLAYWGELERRGFPVQMVVTHGLIATFASVVGISAVLPALIESGITPLTMTEGVEAQLGTTQRQAWVAVLRSTMAESAHGRQTRTQHYPIPDIAFTRMALDPFIAGEVTDEEFAAVIAADPFIAWALSPEATLRIGAWLAHLFDTDLDAALASSAPEHAATFAAFPLRGEDEMARWLSDRFLITDLDQWSPTSLVLEWRYQSGYSVDECPARVLSERSIDRTAVGERALHRLGEREPRRIPPRPLNPNLFVVPARQALIDGRWDAAVEIFRGLVRMLPTDHDTWNNLGFCQLAIDPVEALATLEHAATLRHSNGVLCSSNRALALHRLGRDEDALRVADECLARGHRQPSPATLWAHPSAASNELADEPDPFEYLIRLRDHIAAEEVCREVAS